LNSKELSIYDASGNQCNRFTGESYTAAQAIPSTSTVTPTLLAAATNTSGKGAGVIPITNIFSVTNAGTLTMTYSALQCQIVWSGMATTGPISPPRTLVEIWLCSVPSSSSTAYTKQALLASDTVWASTTASSGTAKSTSTSGSRTAQVTAGYYRVVAYVSAELGTGTSATPTGYWTVTAATVTQNVFRSLHFKQGMVLSQTTSDYVALMSDGSKMIFEALSNGVGIRARSGALQTRSNGSTNWANTPFLLYKGRMKYTSSSDGYTLTMDYAYNGATTGWSAAKSAKGKVTITFPTSIFTDASTIVHAIASPYLGDTDTNGNYYVTLYKMATNTLTFWIADDDSVNNGSFMFDVWKI
jgi:hypothetical protein